MTIREQCNACGFWFDGLHHVELDRQYHNAPPGGALLCFECAKGAERRMSDKPSNPPAFDRDWFFAHLDAMHEAEKAIIAKKNHDYAGSSGADPFANFRRTEALGISSAETGFLVRLSDKISRLAEYQNAGKLMVEDEGVSDTIRDARNYLALLDGYMVSERLRKEELEAGRTMAP